MKSVALAARERIPALGMGTWHMGEDQALRKEEIAALRLGVDLGLTLIDTAEMYGEGRAEALIAEALADRRDEVFLVSKVYPHNASRRGAIAACERSLRRLRTDRLDLYLLHWRGAIPLAETMSAFIELHAAGKIRYYGVSNLDLTTMQELHTVAGGFETQTDQVLYNLTRRGIEWDLLPWLRSKCIPVMAYSPLEEGRLLRDQRLTGFAQRHGMTPAQAALAWLLAKDDVIVIPKAGRQVTVKENAAALEITLNATQLAELDKLFPPPKSPRALEML